MKGTFLIVSLATSFFTALQANADDSIPQAGQLHDIVVKGQRTFVRHTTDGLSITMKGNPLSKIGTAYDALQQMPLVDSSTGTLKVAGKNGTTEIYINNRLVRNQDELKRLLSTDIKDVQIITAPGSRYDSNVSAVIRLRTRRQTNGWSGSVYANLERTEKTSSKTSINLAYTYKNKLSFFGGATLGSNGFRQKRQYHELFDHNRFHTDTYGTSSNRFRNLTANAGFIYDFGENSVGAKYEFERALPSNYRAFYVEQTNASAFDTIYSDYNQKSDSHNHHINAYLNLKMWKHSTLTTETDFVTNGSSTSGWLHENADMAKVSTINTTDNGSYYIIAARTDLESELWKGKLKAGVQYSKTHYSQSFQKDADGEAPELNSGTNKENQHLTAVYLSYEHAIGKYWSWKAGLRYETADFAYFMNGTKLQEQSRNFHDMLPNVQINYTRDGFSAGITYATTINRPNYALLGTNYTYVSHTLWETGNPLLRSSRSHDITLSLNWQGWLLELDYYRNERSIQPVYSYNAGQHINITNYQNMPAYNGFTTTFFKEFTVGFWHPSAQAVVMFQDLKYGTPAQSYNMPLTQLAWNNRLDLPSKWYIFLNGYYLAKGNTGTSKWSGASMLNLTLNKTFGKHWSINLTASDVLNSWRQKNANNTNDVKYNYYIKGGSKGVSLSIMYLFNKTKHSYLGKSAASEEMKRLK